MNRNIKSIPFARPSTGVEEEQAVSRVLKSGWLTTGKEAKALEKEFADILGIPFSKAVNSATAGLHLSLEACGIGEGHLVATTPFTFTATAEIIRYLGADPFFIDIEPDSPNISPEKLSENIERVNKAKDTGKSLKAVIPVHYAGELCRMKQIADICTPNGIQIVEDAAHCAPIPVEKTGIAQYSDAAVYSFYANKHLTTGEGGMVVTSNENLSKRIEIMRLHGIDRESWKRYTEVHAPWQYDVVEAGYKYNMPDINAAIGREQLKKSNAFLKRRQYIAAEYNKALMEYDFCTCPQNGSFHSRHIYPLLLHTEKLTIDRDDFAAKLQDEGVGISVHYIPLHIMAYYKKRYGYKPQDFPNALERFRRTVSIPLYPSLTEEEIRYIIDKVICIGTQYYKG